MLSKITLTLGYILTAVSMLVFFICKAYLLRDTTIIWCILGWIIGLIILYRSEDARDDFKDYLWNPNYIGNKKLSERAERKQKYIKSLSPEARETYLMRKEMEELKREIRRNKYH